MHGLWAIGRFAEQMLFWSTSDASNRRKPGARHAINFLDAQDAR
jgi:hypothetical protein